jgi:hypothetical protein
MIIDERLHRHESVSSGKVLENRDKDIAKSKHKLFTHPQYNIEFAKLVQTVVTCNSNGISAQYSTVKLRKLSLYVVMLGTHTSYSTQ